MYYNKRKGILSIAWIVIGAVLFLMEMTGVLDNPIFSGMGGGLLAVGVMQLVRNVKYHSNPEYKEKVDTAWEDERNRYLRMKAWSWAGYLFLLGAAVVSILLFLAKQTVYGQIVSYCMCAVLGLYWITYVILQKKY